MSVYEHFVQILVLGWKVSQLFELAKGLFLSSLNLVTVLFVYVEIEESFA